MSTIVFRIFKSVFYSKQLEGNSPLILRTNHPSPKQPLPNTEETTKKVWIPVKMGIHTFKKS